MHGLGCVLPCPRVMGPIMHWWLYCVTQPAQIATWGTQVCLACYLMILGCTQYMVALSRILALSEHQPGGNNADFPLLLIHVVPPAVFQ